MNAHRFLQVDVFTRRPLAGNPLAVFLGQDLPDATMQAVAREMNLSETTFLAPEGEGAFSLRIFTPATELPFAGHPVLGSAWVAEHEGYVGLDGGAICLTRSGPIQVRREGGLIWMTQPPVRVLGKLESSDRPALAAALGLKEEDLSPDLPPAVVATGTPMLIVPVISAEAVARCRPEAAGLASVTDRAQARGAYVFALGEGEAPLAAKARFFAPRLGVAEDPATGSAAGPLGGYVGAFVGRVRIQSSPFELAISQGEELHRPSTLHVRVDGDEVHVGGGVVPVLRGEMMLQR